MLLSVDSSSVTASAALTENGKIQKNEFEHSGLTHSETLLPLIKRVMEGTPFSAVDAIAVTTGPGSFTGVRIGVATVKGLAFANDIPCIGVSSLEAVAYNFIGENITVCVVMDARRMQFYNAVFHVHNQVSRLCEDRAISLESLESELRSYDKVIIAGDGAELFCRHTTLKNVLLADYEKRYVNGIGVALAAANGEKVHHSVLMPMYLRPSQAERELKLKRETS